MKFFLHKKEYQHKKQGFTLLETLIGITILVIAIVTTFSAVQGGLSSSIATRDQITAFVLAQEAIEYIRNVRDTNGLNGVNWLTGISLNPSTDPCYFFAVNGKACTVDTTKTSASAFTVCSGAPNTNSCPNLRQDNVTTSQTYGMFGNTAGWTGTKFNREIQISNVTAGQEISVTVLMRWTKGMSVETFEITESILNWQ